MSNLKALGYFMDYCNRNVGRFGVTQARFEAGYREILASPEGRFAYCRDAEDVLVELGW